MNNNIQFLEKNMGEFNVTENMKKLANETSTNTNSKPDKVSNRYSKLELVL